jgi:hypothetical protein
MKVKVKRLNPVPLRHSPPSFVEEMDIFIGQQIEVEKAMEDKDRFFGEGFYWHKDWLSFKNLKGKSKWIN